MKKNNHGKLISMLWSPYNGEQAVFALFLGNVEIPALGYIE
jgi:hypothetical protein